MVAELNLLEVWIPEQMQPGTLFLLEQAGDLGKPEDGIIELRAAIQLQPDHASAHYVLGLAIRDQGNREEAIAEFHKAHDHAQRGSKLATQIERSLAATGP